MNILKYNIIIDVQSMSQSNNIKINTNTAPARGPEVAAITGGRTPIYKQSQHVVLSVPSVSQPA